MANRGAKKALRVQKEAEHILDSVGGRLFDAEALLSKQLDIVVSRSQSLLSLSTVVLTITGFSGPTVAHTSIVAAVSMGLGLSFTLFCLALVLLGSLTVRWSTQFGIEHSREEAYHTGNNDRKKGDGAGDGNATTIELSDVEVYHVEGGDGNGGAAGGSKGKEHREQEQPLRQRKIKSIEKMIRFRDSKQRLSTVELCLLCLGLTAYTISFLDYIIEGYPPKKN